MDQISQQPFALAVDDDPFVLSEVCSILEDAGYQHLEAGNVDEALAVLRAHAGRVQLLFTDVQMPGTRDGFALARATASSWPHIRILVASGQARPGPDDMPADAVFIGKPFSARVVHARLKELLPNGERPGPLRR